MSSDTTRHRVRPGTDGTPAHRLDEARTALVLHRLDPDLRRCSACGADCPCPASQEAARVLVDAGAWTTVPLRAPAAPRRPEPAAPATRRPRLRDLLRGGRRGVSR